MINRAIAINVLGILVAGIIGAWMFPAMSINAPWTVWLMLGITLLYFNFRAAAQSAAFNSPALLAESHRFPRLMEPLRFATFRGILWAAVPIKGFRFLGIRINSRKNTGVAICPADLLESIGGSEIYLIARVKFFLIGSRSARTLVKDRAFRRLFSELGVNVNPESPDLDRLSVYFGWGSGTLHPDAVHQAHLRTSFEEFARGLALTEIEERRVVDDLARQLNTKIDRWHRIKGSPEARTFVRRKEQEDKQ
jgi:hypothetical protein